MASFPLGFNVCITNPPYLGKSSARRRHIEYPWDEDDLYKVCLNTMLRHCAFVAAIIPESYITARIFRTRLWGVISLNCLMFDDTEEPVCLALFTPDGSSGRTRVHTLDGYLGTLEELEAKAPAADFHYEWHFNDPNGSIGVRALDTPSGPDCAFIPGEEISPEGVKDTSRHIVRVSGLPKEIDRTVFLTRCNGVLARYREDTRDVLLTSYRGLRKDGQYRRRLDFRTIRAIMDSVRSEMDDPDLYASYTR